MPKALWISHELISTTPEIRGYRIARQLGVVAELSSASGWTAKVKGNSALQKAMDGFIESAIEMGANGVVGVTVSTFGAGGGITSIVGGDAVGVLITGTAVIVEKSTALE